MTDPKYVRWFNDVGLNDIAIVGGKNASLGEMYQELTPQGIKVPNGFAISTTAYWDTLNESSLISPIRDLISGLDVEDVSELNRAARGVRALVSSAPLPDPLPAEISNAYHQLLDEYGADSSVAVRSSATAEDLPTASFAGQHDTFLNIASEQDLLDSYSKCLASLFTDRAIVYRINNGFDHFQVALSVGVMKMVRSDLAASGVMFSIDTESGFSDVVFITGSLGLGETIVQGDVTPDEYYVHKPTLGLGYRGVLKRTLGTKSIKMVYSDDGRSVQKIQTSARERTNFCLEDEEVLTLANYAIATEAHYSAKNKRQTPMDMEWAKDGIDGYLYLIQARPETVTSQRAATVIEHYQLKQTGPVLITGRAIGDKIASGRANHVASSDDLSSFQTGDILVADTTSPDWGPVLNRAAAIVTNHGGRTCHAAIVARELGIPAVIGTEIATNIIEAGQLITVSCAEGHAGKVYQGEIAHEITTTDLSAIPKCRTELMINLGNPELAFKFSSLPCDGVGLARMEFIVNNSIGIHPMALIHLDKVSSKDARAEIRRLTEIYAKPQDYFVQKLAEGIGTIAAAFYPKPVIVRMSDFKTNEYANLLGGTDFEPVESNPMLGFRGAARYTHPAYQEGFALECLAVRRARETLGLKNIKTMIPFCRNLTEARATIEAMAENGLRREPDDLEIYVMCEVPNNVIQIDEFMQIFDGLSIGSNDLTQLVLGVDRDSEIVSFDFNERDPGVLKMIHMAVDGAKRHKRHAGICGQAPSDYPEITEFLVNIGIDSISLNPDSLLETLYRVSEVEADLIEDKNK